MITMAETDTYNYIPPGVLYSQTASLGGLSSLSTSDKKLLSPTNVKKVLFITAILYSQVISGKLKISHKDKG